MLLWRIAKKGKKQTRFHIEEVNPILNLKNMWKMCLIAYFIFWSKFCKLHRKANSSGYFLKVLLCEKFHISKQGDRKWGEGEIEGTDQSTSQSAPSLLIRPACGPSMVSHCFQSASTLTSCCSLRVAVVVTGSIGSYGSVSAGGNFGCFMSPFFCQLFIIYAHSAKNSLVGPVGPF